MSSRRTRKRERRYAEATARTPGFCGGWGEGLPTTWSDWQLVRRAVREGWPVPNHVRDAVVQELGDAVLSNLEDGDDFRHGSVLVRLLIGMEAANRRSPSSERQTWPTDIPLIALGSRRQTSGSHKSGLTVRPSAREVNDG